MKVFISQLFHEASSFVPPVNISHFKRRHYLKGFSEVLERFKNDKDWIMGALEPFIINNDDITVGICTACNPAGMIKLESFYKIIDDMLNEYSIYVLKNGPPDILMLLLHGANLVATLVDPDSFLIEKFRTISPTTKIGVTLDFHANISGKLVKLADVVIVGIKYPHVDTYARGLLASELIRSDRKLKTFRFPIPILTSLPNQATVENLPFHRLIKFVEAIRQKYKITDLAIAGGFAFADCFDLGMNLIAVNETYSICIEAYKEISEYVWQLKEELLQKIPNLIDVWHRIEYKSSLGRVIVADVSDSPGSGGNADETHLLAKLISSKINFVSAFHVDPRVVQKAINVGIGCEATFTFGSSLSHPKSKTLDVKARVKRILDYEYQNIGPMMNGAKLNGGPTVVLKVDHGLIIVTTERIQAYDINAFINIGIDITKKRPLIIAIKSTAHFRASYTKLADQGIELVRCAGWSDVDFKSYQYHYRRKPLLPLENINKLEWDNIISSNSH